MIPALRDVTAAVHEFGGKIALQIAHAGLWAPPADGERRRRAEPAQPLGPSVRQTEAGPLGREMSLADIEAVTQAFAAAAARAKVAGCDAVQIHAAHGYLLSEFLSPLFNRPTRTGGVWPTGRGWSRKSSAVREAVVPTTRC